MPNAFDARAADYLARSERGAWGALRRRERAAILASLDARPGESVLDAGCGPGYHARELAAAGARPYGVDSSPAMIREFSRLGLPCWRGDILDFAPGRRFDKLLAAGLGEFVSDPARLFARFADLLEPAGLAVMLVPARGAGGAAYRLGQALSGRPVHLHDWDAALAASPDFVLERESPATPLSRILVVRRGGTRG